MRVGSEITPFRASAIPASADRNTSPAPTASPLAAASATGKPASPAALDTINFKHATRQELFDWMNKQILSGKMSLDESTPFLGMTLKISAATGQHVDMATDTTRIDFMQRARDGIEGALWHSDYDLAERLHTALGTMQRLQNQSTSVDLLA